MCSKPPTINGIEVSCRECDDCAKTYKNGWIARCVAEKATLPYAYAITLTYADVDGEPPLGARVYRYRDVALMWKRIRAAAKRRWKDNLQLRYVIVGEKGSRFGRCHYHGVVFADRPIHELGQLEGKNGQGFAYKRRVNWSLWGHGFVEFQQADRKGMAYVLKYILKSRMTAARSKGFGREGKTEWLASSYLWCSKKPPIGAVWLHQKLTDLVAKGMSPASLRVRVPGGGDWYVSGEAQRQMCVLLHHANEEYRANFGRELAGFSTLLESVSEPIENSETGEILHRKPWEWLKHGEETENETTGNVEQAERQWQRFKAEYAAKRRLGADLGSARAVVQRCGNVEPCEICAASIAPHVLADIQQERAFRRAEWVEHGSPGRSDAEPDQGFVQWWQTRLRPSRGCQIRNAEIVQRQFRRLIGITKASPNTTHKKAVGRGLQNPAPFHGKQGRSSS